MIDIEPDGPTKPGGADGIPTHDGADDVRIISNDIGKATDLFFTCTGAPATVNDVTIANNILRGRALTILITGFTTVPRSNYLIENNQSDSPTQTVYGAGMIRLRNVVNAVISNNTAPVGSKPAVTVNGSNKVTIGNNHFPGATSLVVVDQPPSDFPATSKAAVQWGAKSGVVTHCGNDFGSAGSQTDSPCT